MLMDCLSIIQKSYERFTDELHQAAVKERLPVNGSLALTYRCNMACAHCYGVVEPKNKELSTREIFLALDEMADAGCLWLLLTGGEPLMREDFLDIYLYAKRKGFIVTLFSNGTLLNSEVADCLKSYPPFMVEITLYGASRQVYERVTGVIGSYDKCVSGIDLLLDKGIPLKLKTTLTTANKEELADIKAFAKKKTDSVFRYDPVLSPKLNGDRKPCVARISPQEVIVLESVDEKRSKEWFELFQKFGNQGELNKIFNCEAGRTFFHIDPYGQMRMCEMVRQPAYDIFKLGFKKIWDELFMEELALPCEDRHPCKNCRSFVFCDICPGWAQLETGEVKDKVEYLCRLAELRAEAFGVTV